MDHGYIEALRRIRPAKAEKRIELDLSGLELTAVPPEIGQLSGLQSLDMRYNQLTAVPSEIWKLPGLKSLDLQNNELTAIPPEITQLTDLQSLHLHGNKLTTIPSKITQLTTLQKLSLSKNRLTVVPSEIRYLTNLQVLYLWGNQLTIIPEWLGRMPYLEELYITENPITQPPPEILGTALTGYPWDDGSVVDLEAIHRYYTQLAKEGEATIYEAKLLLIGEGGAGKTSLARKLINASSRLPPPNDSTKGIDVHPWHFPLPADHQPSPEPVEGRGTSENSDDWGQFSHRQLRALWGEPAYANHQPQLLALMQRFQLCYELPQKRGHFIAPQMLRPQAPPYEWPAKPDDLQLRFHYPHFMPRGIVNRAVVILHEYIAKQQFVWRSGVLLKNGSAYAELLELRGEKEIRIRIGGSRKLDFLMPTVQTLDKLHEGFSSKLSYEKRVPCRCERCIQPDTTPHFFDLKYLRDRLASPKQSKWVVECRYKPFHDIHVRNLIDDAILQMDQRGGDTHHHYHQDYVGGDKVGSNKVGGDQIQVGDISDAQDVAIGTDASASASS